MEQVWTTRAGTAVPVAKMTTAHVRNCLGLLRAQLAEAEVDLGACYAFPAETMASYYAEHGSTEAALRIARASAWVDVFERELARRGSR